MAEEDTTKTVDKDQPAAEYVPSTVQTAWEEQLAAEEGKVTPAMVGRDFSGGASQEDLDAFVGVSPEYRNYANDTEKPRWAEEDSAEAEMERRHVDHSDHLIVGFSQEELDQRAENDRLALEQKQKDVDNGLPLTSPPAASMANVDTQPASKESGGTSADVNQVAPTRAGTDKVTKATTKDKA